MAKKVKKQPATSILDLAIAKLEKEKTAGVVDIRELLISRFGEDKLTKWEKEYAPRKLNAIVVEDKLCVLRPISATEVSEYSVMFLSGIGLEKANRYLLSELWVDGDMELQNDEEYFIGAMLQIERTVQLKKSSFYRL